VQLELKEPFRVLMETGRIQDYCEALCTEGPAWLFDLDFRSLFLHLTALKTQSAQAQSAPGLKFLFDALNPATCLEDFSAHYERFSKNADTAGAAAAVICAVNAIWAEGDRFSRFDPWHQIARELVDNACLSPLGQAALHAPLATIEYTGWGDIFRARETFARGLSLAEQAASPSLQVYFAAGLGNTFAYQAEIDRLQGLIFDYSPIADLPEVSPTSRALFQILRAIALYLAGDTGTPKDILREIVYHPDAQFLPGGVWFFATIQLFLTACCDEDHRLVEEISHLLQETAVRSHNNMIHGYVHMSFGVAALNQDNPQKAYFHANESMNRVQRSQCYVQELNTALLIGQSLSDLNRFEEALVHLENWIPKMQRAGTRQLQFSAELELVNLLSKQGQIDRARGSFDKIVSVWPKGYRLPAYFRRARFVEGIERTLMPTPAIIVLSEHKAPIRIEVFGEFRLTVRDHIIYDRKWKDRRTKVLLKAIVALGGSKVPLDSIIDLVWPDSDGDRALSSLKVALSRLRKTGWSDGESPLQWLAVKHHKVSLVKPLCFVDCIHFSEIIDYCLKEKFDIESLRKALGLYKGDFLERETFPIWIINHREQLRAKYVEAVKAIVNHYRTIKRPQSAISYLQDAISKEPLDEELYSLLMESQIDAGYPSQALRVFNKAKAVLSSELDALPGERLCNLAKQARPQTP
jgi:DNA-binding SARP family transcriptional activator